MLLFNSVLSLCYQSSYFCHKTERQRLEPIYNFFWTDFDLFDLKVWSTFCDLYLHHGVNIIYYIVFLNTFPSM